MTGPLEAARAVSASSRRSRIALVDDHALFRRGMQAVIDGCADLTVACEAANAHEAFALVAKFSFECDGVAVLLPALGGVWVTREFVRRQPSCHVLALSAVEEPYQVATILRAG